MSSLPAPSRTENLCVNREPEEEVRSSAPTSRSMSYHIAVIIALCMVGGSTQASSSANSDAPEEVVRPASRFTTLPGGRIKRDSGRRGGHKGLGHTVNKADDMARHNKAVRRDNRPNNASESPANRVSRNRLIGASVEDGVLTEYFEDGHVVTTELFDKEELSRQADSLDETTSAFYQDDVELDEEVKLVDELAAIMEPNDPVSGHRVEPHFSTEYGEEWWYDSGDVRIPSKRIGDPWYW